MLKQGEGLGCAGLLALVNVLLMGLVAFSFSHGPYSSPEQETWYRYRSLAFFLWGAILPTVILWLGRRSPMIVAGATVWMFLALVLFGGYVLNSGGGV
jgi:hypothetical protein